MSRTAVVTALAVFVAVALLSSTAEAQQTHGTAVEQTPGIFERIMTDYIYPIRDMDWRHMVRSFLENMMNYIAPDAKEPKIGGLLRNREDLRIAASVIGLLLENLGDTTTTTSSEEKQRSKRNKRGESTVEKEEEEEANVEKTRLKRSSSSDEVASGRMVLTTNSNLSNEVAGYSWTYLGLLTLYTAISVYTALTPLFKVNKEELLEELGDEGMPPMHHHMETPNLFQI